MRILIVSNYYPPYEIGGYEQLCRDVVVRLDERGHHVTVLTSDHGVGRDRSGGEPGVFRKLQIQPRYDTWLSPAAQFVLSRRRVEAHNRRVFDVVAQQVHPEVVFFWNLEGLPHELAIDAEARPQTATAYWLAGISPAAPDAFWRYWTQPPGKNVFLEGLKGRLRRAALGQMRREGKPVRPQMQHVGVVSEYMRRKGIADATLPADAEVIYNGVETDRFYRPVPPPGAPAPVQLLVAGRVSADKGVHVAVEAMGRLAQTRPQRDFRLVVAGSGPPDYLKTLHQLATTGGVQSLISYTGWLPREQMPDLMRASHILLLPTVEQEPFARVVLEGMAAGLAVVGTLTGGTGELLCHEVDGLACQADDSEDLARQIGRLLDDPHLRYRLASGGQQMVLERYDLAHMVARIEDLLDRAVSEQEAHQEL